MDNIEENEFNFDIDLSDSRAASGSFINKFHSGTGYYYGIGITWTVNSQSTSTNSSNVTVKLYLQSSGSGTYIYSSVSKNVYLTINGTQYSGTSSVAMSPNQTKYLLTKTVDIKHNSDGTKTCSLSGSCTFGITLSGTYYGTISTSGNATFDKINLNSAPSLSGSVTLSPSGTIAENTSSIKVTWPAATDAQNNITGYKVCRYINSSLNSTFWPGKVTSYTDSGLSSFGQGTKIHYTVAAYDSYSAYSGTLTSATATKNTLTGATLASSSTIGSSGSISFTWSGGKNTNGTAVTYDLTANGITVYRATGLTGTSLSVAIASSAPSSGAYILLNDLKNKFSSSNYSGTLSFTLTTKNSYGSTKTSSKTLNVNLGSNPTAATVSISTTASESTAYVKPSGLSTYYFVPNGTSSRIIRIKWSGASDPLGQSFKYDVLYKIGNGSYITAISNTTASYYNLQLPARTAKETLTAKVITKTNTGSSSKESSAVDLHYYNAPSITLVNVSRTGTSATAKVKFNQNTSITGITLTGRYTGASTGNLSNSTAEQTITASGISSTSTSSWTVYLKDNAWQTTEKSLVVNIPYANPILSVREKGIGVNCIPESGGSYTFYVNGKSKLTDNLYFNMNGRNSEIFKIYGGDVNGHHVRFGGGGCTIVGAGESGTSLESLVGTSEDLHLSADNGIEFYTNCNTIENRIQTTLKDGLLTIKTGSTSSNKGLKIVGSSTQANLWAGSSGVVLQSYGDYNLHLGRNNSTDMIFNTSGVVVARKLYANAGLTMSYSSNEATLGIGGTDIYLYNKTANKYLQLKNTGSLTFSDVPVMLGNGSVPFTGTVYYNATPSTSNGRHITIDTTHDSNAAGDGKTHLGYRTTAGYNHYFRGKGAFNVNNTGGIYLTGSDVYANRFKTGSTTDTNYRPFESYRKNTDQNKAWGTKYAASSVGSVKLASTSTASFKYGGTIETAESDGTAVRRYAFLNDCFIAASDNNTYLGTSSHRWQAVYATSGQVYSSSKDEKIDINPITTLTRTASNYSSTKDIIINGIKDLNLYSYKYKSLDTDAEFVGFLGQELEEGNKEFFDLIGSSYITEEGNVQYDIRETSVIGTLYVGLQEALNENQNLRQELELIKEKLELTNK